MKLQAPEDFSGGSIGGEDIVLEDDGTVEFTSAATVDALKAHGFVEVRPAPAARPKVSGKKDKDAPKVEDTDPNKGA